MNAARPAAVLFDLDGTLLDSAPDLGAAADILRTRRGLSNLPMEHYRPAAGAGARGLLKVAFGIEQDHPDFAALRDEFLSAYESRLTMNTRPFDGILEVLQALQRHGTPWGVVTNKARRFAEPLTRSISGFDGLSVLVCGDTTPYTKPHPAPLLEAARVLGARANACWYVGDDLRDMQAAAAAGMYGVAATYGYVSNPNDTQHWPAEKRIDQPTDLLKLLSIV
ncbi:MAG: HAD family hydrolase [Burkholderiaceae bacterium]